MKPETERQVPVLGALAQATRLRIVAIVAQAGTKGVVAGEIARELGCPASTLSFHLKELSRAGILGARPRGRFVIYAMQPGVLGELAQFIAGLAGADSAPGARPRGAGSRSKTRRRRSADRDQLSMFGD